MMALQELYAGSGREPMSARQEGVLGLVDAWQGKRKTALGGVRALVVDVSVGN